MPEVGGCSTPPGGRRENTGVLNCDREGEELCVCRNGGLPEVGVEECSMPVLYMNTSTAGDHRYPSGNGRGWAVLLIFYLIMVVHEHWLMLLRV